MFSGKITTVLLLLFVLAIGVTSTVLLYMKKARFTPELSTPVVAPVKQEEKILYNITPEQFKKDLIGKQVTLDDNSRWVFTKEEKIGLSKIDEDDTVGDGIMVTIVRIVSRPPKSKDFLDGYLKLRYERQPTGWRLTEVSTWSRLDRIQKSE